MMMAKEPIIATSPCASGFVRYQRPQSPYYETPGKSDPLERHRGLRPNPSPQTASELRRLTQVVSLVGYPPAYVAYVLPIPRQVRHPGHLTLRHQPAEMVLVCMAVAVYQLPRRQVHIILLLSSVFPRPPHSPRGVHPLRASCPCSQRGAPSHLRYQPSRNQAPRQADHSCDTPVKDAIGDLPHLPVPVYSVTNPHGNNARPRGIAWRSIIPQGLAGFTPSWKTNSAPTAPFMLVFRALELLFRRVSLTLYASCVTFEPRLAHKQQPLLEGAQTQAEMRGGCRYGD